VERKAGQFIKEMKEQDLLLKGRPEKGSQVARLSDYDVDKDESSRWQKIADIPEERFEEYLVNAKKKKDVKEGSITFFSPFGANYFTLPLI